MGYRIHRAMGWGMEWNQFEELTSLDCEAHETSEALYDVFHKTKTDDLVIPMSHRNSSIYGGGPGPRRTPILDNHLLALDFSFSDTELEIDDAGYERRKRIGPKLGSPDSLFSLVMDPDNIHAVIFYVNAREAKNSQRYDDNLDYQFEALRDGIDGDPNPRDFITWMKFNPYPYSNNLMETSTGLPLEWDLYSRLDKTYPQGWSPDIPSEIRWYLPKLGILDEAGVNKLRPLIAQWWC